MCNDLGQSVLYRGNFWLAELRKRHFKLEIELPADFLCHLVGLIIVVSQELQLQHLRELFDLAVGEGLRKLLADAHVFGLNRNAQESDGVVAVD